MDPEAEQIKGFGCYKSLDGKYVYKIGVIDFLTEYGNIKYFENKLKSV